MTNNDKVCQILTDRIIGLLESGTVPWARPWAVRPSARPTNATTGNAYRGINEVLLSALGYEDPRFLTFKQAKERFSGYPHKGERGYPIMISKRISVPDESAPPNDDGSPARKAVPLLRYYTVFNVAQCHLDGLPSLPHEEPKPPFETLQAAEAILSGFPTEPAPPRLLLGGNEACYSAPADAVWLPSKESFDRPADFYATAFHEYAHATGHADRLNRPDLVSIQPFGSPDYSREELIAEMTATFLCDRASIVNETIDRSAAYIENWLARLKGDRRLVVSAASQASKAAAYILGEPVPGEE